MVVMLCATELQESYTKFHAMVEIMVMPAIVSILENLNAMQRLNSKSTFLVRSQTLR